MCAFARLLVLRLILRRGQKIGSLGSACQSFLGSLWFRATAKLEVLESFGVALRQGIVAVNLVVLVVLVGFEIGLIGVVKLFGSGLVAKGVVIVALVLFFVAGLL